MDSNDKYVGRILDNRYEILELIGTGGMALVYKARCHRLNRMVAIKILKEDLAGDEEFQRRFYTESQAVAMLSHPNIVAVYDVSRAGNTEYIVMELIEGITLKQYINRKGLLNWKEALHFATQITKALSHAHSRGIIHRDIKPHNIMILKDGSVKVADFGIARLLTVSNTLTQEALGSVHYISPEQAKGGHVDARSDIYSVGVVMYEMLTSRLPFVGDSAVSVAIQHISAIPLMPRDINPDVPIGLEDITMHAMEPDLNMRFTTAEEMLADLEEFRKNPSIVFNYQNQDVGRVYIEDDVFDQTLIMPRTSDGAVARPANMQQRQPNTQNPNAAQNASVAPAQPQQITRNPNAQRTNKSRQQQAMQNSNVSGEQDRAAERSGFLGRGAKKQKQNMTQDEYRVAKTRASSTSTLIGIFSVLVFLIIIVVFMWNFFLGDIFRPQTREQLSIPNFVNRRVETIANNTYYTDLYNFAINEEYSIEFAQGVIMAQSPVADRLVTEPLPGARINVTLYVSRGAPPPTLMPDLIGRLWSFARNELLDKNLNLQIELVEVASDIPISQVIETIPAAGEPLGLGHTVIIRYSGGPDIPMVTIPNLDLPVSLAAFNTAFRGLDVEVSFDERYDENNPADTVTFVLHAGEEVPAGTRIAVTLSLGPEYIPEPEPDEPEPDPYPPQVTPDPPTHPGDTTPPTGTEPPDELPPLIDDIFIDDTPEGDTPPGE